MDGRALITTRASGVRARCAMSGRRSAAASLAFRLLEPDARAFAILPVVKQLPGGNYEESYKFKPFYSLALRARKCGLRYFRRVICGHANNPHVYETSQAKHCTSGNRALC
jgi:hypothetical protein